MLFHCKHARIEQTNCCFGPRLQYEVVLNTTLYGKHERFLELDTSIPKSLHAALLGAIWEYSLIFAQDSIDDR